MSIGYGCKKIFRKSYVSGGHRILEMQASMLHSRDHFNDIYFSRAKAIIGDVKRIGLRSFQELRIKGLDRVTFKFNGSLDLIKQT